MYTKIPFIPFKGVENIHNAKKLVPLYILFRVYILFTVGGKFQIRLDEHTYITRITNLLNFTTI